MRTTKRVFSAMLLILCTNVSWAQEKKETIIIKCCGGSKGQSHKGPVATPRLDKIEAQLKDQQRINEAQAAYNETVDQRFQSVQTFEKNQLTINELQSKQIDAISQNQTIAAEQPAYNNNTQNQPIVYDAVPAGNHDYRILPNGRNAVVYENDGMGNYNTVVGTILDYTGQAMSYNPMGTAYTLNADGGYGQYLGRGSNNNPCRQSRGFCYNEQYSQSQNRQYSNQIRQQGGSGGHKHRTGVTDYGGPSNVGGNGTVNNTTTNGGPSSGGNGNGNGGGPGTQGGNGNVNGRNSNQNTNNLGYTRTGNPIRQMSPNAPRNNHAMSGNRGGYGGAQARSYGGGYGGGYGGARMGGGMRMGGGGGARMGGGGRGGGGGHGGGRR